MTVAKIMPTANFLTKIGKMQSMPSAGCWLCRTTREACGESTDSLAAKTHGHINSAGCRGMARDGNGCPPLHDGWRHLYDSLHAAQKSKGKLKFVTLNNVRSRGFFTSEPIRDDVKLA